MKRVRIAELKAHLSQYLRAAQRGQTIVVVDRETPIARLVPLERSPAIEIIPPTDPTRNFWQVPPSTAPPPKIDVVELLLEDRARR
ncbi:MAG: type II toxin-antitoxin system Phd/YefM family antitoxin [Terriglobales bacterium]